MEELIKLVAKKVNISEAQAKQAVDTVVKFLKSRLPGPVGNQIDSLLSGKGTGDIAGKAGDMLGGLLGKKKG